MSNPGTTVCQTCKGRVRILHVYSRGPDSPPGNQWIGCPDCAEGRAYTEKLLAEIVPAKFYTEHPNG